MKKRFSSILAIMVIVAVFGGLMAGCQGKSGVSGGKQEVNFPMIQELDTLDPQAANSMPAANIMKHCYEGLVRVSNGKVQPGMAEKWDISQDGLTYTFHLRDAKWSDGSPVTAQDFENGLKRLVDPANGFGYAWAASSILNAGDYNAKKITDFSQVGIKAIDAKTLEIKIVAPAKYFLGYMDLACFLPTKKEQADKEGKNFGTEPATVLYNGPFIVKEWKHEQSITLEKNPNYWDKDKIKLEKITGIRVAEWTTAINMFENGELDFSDVPPALLTQYQEKGTVKLYMSGADDWIKINMARNDKPWLQNVDFRKALIYAIDREEVMTLATKGLYFPAARLVLPIVSGEKDYYVKEHPMDVYSAKADTTKAKEYLDKAMKALNITDPKAISVEFLISDDETGKNLAQAIQDQVAKNLGINFTIKTLQRKQQLAQDMAGDFDLVYAGWAPDYDDPLTYLEFYQSSNALNSGKYNNPEYDRLVELGRHEPDTAKRLQHFADAEKLLLETDAAIVPLNFRQRAWVCKDGLENVSRFFIGSDLDLTYAYIK